MTENKVTTKPRTQLDLDFFELNICKDKVDRPFLNVFSFSGKNFEEQRLGQIFGVIQVLDKSEHSAYIPNLITQIIKKEYFRDRKRNIEKAFEAALHKANLALTDLAQHEIIEWMGKLNAVIGTIQKNNFYFTQAGGGRILLLRNKLINDITRGLDDGEGVGHPIKTFSNVSSGKIEIGDKLIFASESVFESVKWEELKRHSQTFNSSELDNIFRSTLELESPLSGAILINAKEKQMPTVPPEKKKEGKIKNFFGAKQSTVENNKPIALPPAPKKNEKAEHVMIDASATKKKQPGETFNKQLLENNLEQDTTTAVQNDVEDDEDMSPFERQPELFVRSDEQLPEKKSTPFFAQKQKAITDKIKKLLHRAVLTKNIKQNQPPLSKQSFAYGDILLKHKENLVRLGKISANKLNLENLKKLFLDKKPRIIENEHPMDVNVPVASSKIMTDKKISIGLRIKTFFSSAAVITKTLPDKFRHQDKKIWLIVAPAMIAIAIVLIFTIIFATKPTKEENFAPQNKPDETQQNPDGAQAFEDLASFEKNVKSMAFLNGNIYILTEDDGFFELNPNDKKMSEIQLPSDASNFILLSQMPPLNLIFLISDKTVLSYSPVTVKFSTNQINFPNGLEAISADTYLTYLYVLDKNSGQVFQYPRAAGGFGQGKPRLKQEFSANDLNDMAIDGSIYIAQKNQPIRKFFNGKQEIFNVDLHLENPIVWAKSGSEEIVVADSASGKVMIMSNGGNIIKEMENPDFKESKDLWYDQQNKAIYLISRNNEIMKIKMD